MHESTRKSRAGQRHYYRIPGIFLLLLASTLLLTFTTAWGQQMFIRLIDKMRDDVSIGAVHGSLHSTLVLDNVVLTKENMQLSVQQVSVKLNLYCLLQSKICIDSLAIENASLNLDSSDDTQPVSFDQAQVVDEVQNFVQSLPLVIELNEFKLKNFTLRSQDHSLLRLASFSLTASILKSDRLVTHITGEASYDQYHLDFDGDLSVGVLNTMPIMATINTRFMGANIVPIDAKLKLQGEIKQDLSLLLNTQGMGTGRLLLKYNILKNESLKAKIELSDALFDVHHTPVVLEKLSLDARFDPQTLAYQLKGFINARIQEEQIAIPLLDIHGSKKQMVIKKMKLIHSDSSSEISGRLRSVDDTLSFELKSTFGIDLQKWLPHLPLVGSGMLDSAGYFNTNFKRWAINVNALRFDGLIKNEPLTLSLKATSQHNNYLNVEQGSISIAGNEMSLNGLLNSDNSSFSAHINAPDLKRITDSINGEIIGDIKIQGNLLKPEINTNLRVHKLITPSFSLESLKLIGVTTSDGQLHANADLILDSLVSPYFTFDTLSIKIAGSEQAHLINLDLKGSPLGIDASMTGHFDRDNYHYQALVRQHKISADALELHLQQPLIIDYFPLKQLLSLSEHCWINDEIELCFDKVQDIGKNGELVARVKQLDMQLFSHYLPLTTNLKGKASAQIKLYWGDRPLGASMIFNAPTFELTQRFNNRHIRFNFDKVNLNARISNDNLYLEASTLVAQGGKLNGDLIINNLSKERRLDGSLSLIEGHLADIQPYLLPNEIIDGKISMQTIISGDLRKPIIVGNIAIDQLNLQTALLPSVVNAGTIRAYFLGDNLTLEGDITTPSGSLSLAGKAQWQGYDHWQANLSIDGDHLQSQISSVGSFDLSPHVQLSLTPQNLDITGVLNINSAHLTFKNLSNGQVSVSEDEIILHDEIQSMNAEGVKFPFNLTANIDIKAQRESVKIDAFGLSGFVFGELKIRQSQEGFGLYGKAQLDNATYLAYGQNLDIRAGSATFTGRAAYPELNIEAVRTIDERDKRIIAGIRLSGNVSSPQISVFSEPTLSRTEALSYIISGKGFDDKASSTPSDDKDQHSEGIDVSKLVGNVGGNLSHILIANLAQEGLNRIDPLKNIQNVIGFKDISANIESGASQIYLTLSAKFLDLFNITYKRGLYKNFNEVSIGYHIYRNLYLQWLYNVNHNLDLIYSIEFD